MWWKEKQSLASIMANSKQSDTSIIKRIKCNAAVRQATKLHYSEIQNSSIRPTAHRGSSNSPYRYSYAKQSSADLQTQPVGFDAAKQLNALTGIDDVRDAAE